MTVASTELCRPEQLDQELKRQPQVIYAGVDPTAKYLHVGHLLPLLCLLHFQLRGHKVISLVRLLHVSRRPLLTCSR